MQELSCIFQRSLGDRILREGVKGDIRDEEEKTWKNRAAGK